MIPQRVIEAKRDGQTLSPQQLTELLTGYARGEVPEHQMAAFLMAVAHGIAVQAKAGFSRDALVAVADQALAGWPGK